MKNENKIDQLFYDELNDFEIRPSEQVWQQVQKQTATHKYMQLIRFWLIKRGLALPIIGSLAFLFWSAQSSENISNQNLPIAIETLAKHTTDPAKTGLNDKELSLSKTDGHANEPFIQTQVLSQAKGFTPKASSESESQPSNDIERNYSNTSLATTQPLSNSGSKKQALSTGSPTDSKLERTESIIRSSKLTAFEPESEQTNRAQKSEMIPSNTDQSYSQSNSSLAVSSHAPSFENASAFEAVPTGLSGFENQSRKQTFSENLAQVSRILPMSNLRVHMLENQFIEPTLTNLSRIEQAGIERFHRIPLRYSIALLATYQQGITHYSGTDVQKNVLEQSYQNLEAYSAQLLGQVDYRRWRFGLGFAYSLHNENFKYAYQNFDIQQSTQYDTTHFEYYTNEWVFDGYYYLTDSNSMVYDSIPIYNVDSVWHAYDSISSQTITDTSVVDHQINSANRVKYFEIPIIFSYKLRKNNFSFPISVGLVNGIYIRSQGKGIVFDQDLTVVESSVLPWAQVHFMAYLGLGIEYKIRNRWGIRMDAFYKYQLNSIYKSGVSPNQKSDFYGLNVGLQYYFN